MILQLGPLKVHSYGFMLALAFLVGIYLAGRAARRVGETQEHVTDLSFWIIVAAVIGSRLFHVLVFWSELQPPRLLSAFKIWEGGLVYYGGFIGAVTASVLFCRLKKIDFWQMADIITPSIALGLMFGRIGCTLVGCCYGKACPADYPLAIVFPPETIGVAGVPLYPTQLLEAAGCLAIALFLWFYLQYHRRFRGQLLLVFIVLYSALRFTLEFWRDDPRGFADLFTFAAAAGQTPAIGGLRGFLLWSGTIHEISSGIYGFYLSESQLVSLMMTLAVIPLWIWKSRRDRRLGVSVAPAPVPDQTPKRAPHSKGKAKRK